MQRFDNRQATGLLVWYCLIRCGSACLVSDLHAEPVYGPAYVNGERLPLFRGHAFPMVFRKNSAASSREIRLRAGASFSAPAAPGQHCCHEQLLAHLFPIMVIFIQIQGGDVGRLCIIIKRNRLANANPLTADTPQVVK